MYKELKVKGKTVIVTGGANGIGKACCEKLAKHGAKIIIADIDDAHGLKVEEKLRKKGKDVFFIHTDVTIEADVKEMVKFAKEKFGKIDILINDAAIQKVTDFENISLDEWKRVIDVNLNGGFLCCREVVKELNNGGQILNIITVHSGLPRTGKYSYDASKAGMEILTKELAKNYADKNITVNAISFGAVATPMNEEWLDDEVAVNHTLSKVPMNIIFKSSEIARFIYEILKNFSLYTTGSVFVVDGGRSLIG